MANFWSWGNFKWPYAKKCTTKDPEWICCHLFTLSFGLVASPGLWDLQVDLDLAENVDLLLYFKILHRNKETAWTNKYMDVISKDEPFRFESFSFFEQLGRKLIFFFLHKRSIFCSFSNFSWKFNIHSFHRLKWAMNRLFIFSIDRVISFLRLGSKHFLPDFSSTWPLLLYFQQIKLLYPKNCNPINCYPLHKFRAALRSVSYFLQKCSPWMPPSKFLHYNWNRLHEHII